MKTLVWVEHEGGALKDATLAAVTAASKLGEVHLLVAGAGVAGVLVRRGCSRGAGARARRVLRGLRREGRPLAGGPVGEAQGEGRGGGELIVATGPSRFGDAQPP